MQRRSACRRAPEQLSLRLCVAAWTCFSGRAPLLALTRRHRKQHRHPRRQPRSGTFPKPVEETLPNGLRVIVIERQESPLVSAQLLIKNGGEVDPPELAGLADMTANLLTKGTQTSRRHEDRAGD